MTPNASRRVDAHLRARAAELAATDPTDLAQVRAIVDTLAIDSRPLGNVQLVRSESGTTQGVWVLPENGDPSRRIVYCHGGSFMAGSIALYGGMLSRLAAAACACLFFVDYRLAPEHTFPAAHDDCTTAFSWVREHGPYSIAPAKACFLASDSAGAGLAIDAALSAARAGDPPDGVVMFSPFVDMTLSGESCVTNNGRDPFTTYEQARACASIYAPGVDPRDVRLSPLFAELSSLCPIQIHGSNSDLLRDDALRLADLARKAGIASELYIWGNVPHVWYLFPEELPQASAGIELAGEFLSRT